MPSKRLLLMLDEIHWPTIDNFQLLYFAKYINHSTTKGMIENMKVLMATATSSGLDLEGFEKVARIDLDEQPQYPIQVNWHSRDFTLAQLDQLWSDTLTVVRSFVDQASAAAAIAAGSEAVGAILVFVPGEREIERLSYSLESDVRCDVRWACSTLPQEDLDAIYLPASVGRVKIVLATNVAENAITIPDVCVVVDTCLRKVPHAPTHGVFGTALVLEWSSHNSCMQRKGRTGRTAPGIYHPMCTEKTLKSFTAYDVSEFLRIPPYLPVLELLALNLDAQSIYRMPNLRYNQIIQRLTDLKLVAMVNDFCCVTSDGRAMRRYRMALEHAVMLHRIPANDSFLLHSTLVLIAMIEGGGHASYFFYPRDVRRGSERLQHDEKYFEQFRAQDDLAMYFGLWNAMVEQAWTAEQYGGRGGGGRRRTQSMGFVFREFARTNSLNNQTLKRARQIYREHYPVLFNNIRPKSLYMVEKKEIDRRQELARKLVDVYGAQHCLFSRPTVLDTRQGLVVAYQKLYQDNKETKEVTPKRYAKHEKPKRTPMFFVDTMRSRTTLFAPTLLADHLVATSSALDNDLANQLDQIIRSAAKDNDTTVAVASTAADIKPDGCDKKSTMATATATATVSKSNLPTTVAAFGLAEIQQGPSLKLLISLIIPLSITPEIDHAQ
jgi:HrpA-like RNA helicase